jgi:hypothetical protein
VARRCCDRKAVLLGPRRTGLLALAEGRPRAEQDEVRALPPMYQTGAAPCSRILTTKWLRWAALLQESL